MALTANDDDDGGGDVSFSSSPDTGLGLGTAAGLALVAGLASDSGGSIGSSGSSGGTGGASATTLKLPAIPAPTIYDAATDPQVAGTRSVNTGKLKLTDPTGALASTVPEGVGSSPDPVPTPATTPPAGITPAQQSAIDTLKNSTPTVASQESFGQKILDGLSNGLTALANSAVKILEAIGIAALGALAKTLLTKVLNSLFPSSANSNYLLLGGVLVAGYFLVNQ